VEEEQNCWALLVCCGFCGEKCPGAVLMLCCEKQINW